MKSLEAVGICRDYGKQKVLKDLDFSLEAGSFEALMGPSGCGKSTFLHIAAGLLGADAGKMLIGGKDVLAMKDAEVSKFRRRHVGVVFQAFNLLSERTVRENIVLPLTLDGALPDARRLSMLMEALGLTGLEEKLPEELSGGEQQRVAIARALVAEPDVVLADEPTGNLDARASKRICELLKVLNRTEKSAILLVTHDPVVASVANRVHFLCDGKIATSFEPNGDPSAVSRLYLETCR